jgi:hypothetical protein
MRILKYIFLLVLLSLFALTVFVATQKGDFSVERSKIIKSTRYSLYNYVNDYRNWEDFGSWTKENKQIKITYPEKTVGVGSSFSWISEEENGTIKTLSVKENDSIVQKMDYDGTVSDVFWSFKDTTGGVKVTWKSKGKMSFAFKIYSAINGGVDQIIGTMYEKSLINLDKNLVSNVVKTFTVTVDGVRKKLPTFYLHQTFTCDNSKINKNVGIVVPKILEFCKTNKITISGKPFVLYRTYDTIKDLANITIGVPIKSEIVTSVGSDILSGKMEAFPCVKTTLTGDYENYYKAIEKTEKYFKTNDLTHDVKFSHLEIYTIGKTEEKNASKWVTTFYYPTMPKVIAPPKVYKPKIKKEITTDSLDKTTVKPTVKPTEKPTEIPSEF